MACGADGGGCAEEECKDDAVSPIGDFIALVAGSRLSSSQRF